jgi:ATP synthase subunit 6
MSLNTLFIGLVLYFADFRIFGKFFYFKLQFFFEFILTLFKESLILKKYSPILLFFYTFCFVFCCNLLGLIPYSITVTSHLIITLYFSFGFFIGTNIISVLYHKEKYFELFLPDGIPVIIIPSLILIEYISYISKIFSLAIRLFANMLSGHILLKILIGFV